MLGVFSLTQLNTLFTSSSELGNERMPRITITGNMRVDFMSTRLTSLSYVLAETVAEKKAVKEMSSAHIKNYNSKLEQLKETAKRSGSAALLESLGESFSVYETALERFYEVVDGGNLTELKELRANVLNVAGADVVANMAEFVQYQNTQAKHTIERSAEINKTSFLLS